MHVEQLGLDNRKTQKVLQSLFEQFIRTTPSDTGVGATPPPKGPSRLGVATAKRICTIDSFTPWFVFKRQKCQELSLIHI